MFTNEREGTKREYEHRITGSYSVCAFTKAFSGEIRRKRFFLWIYYIISRDLELLEYLTSFGLFCWVNYRISFIFI